MTGHARLLEDQILSGRLRRVILDIDGTLIDSNEAHAQAWYEGFRRAAAEVDPRLQTVTLDAIRHRIGIGGDQLFPAVTRDCLGEALGHESDAGRVASLGHRFLSSDEP